MNQQQPPQPQSQQRPSQPQSNELKSLPFALFPFGIVILLSLVGFWQNNAAQKISALNTTQNVSAENVNAKPIVGQTDLRPELKKCFTQLKYRSDGVDRLTDKQVNDELFDCKEELRRQS